MDRVAEVVLGLAPDVVMLQEVRRAQCRRLARRLGWQRAWFRKHHPYSPLMWWRTEGMAIISRHDLSDTSVQSLTPSISTWTYRHRVVVRATVTRDDGARLHVIDVHLASDAEAGSDRLQQAEIVRRLVDDGGRPCVVAGDLNDHGDSRVVTVLGGGSHADAWDVAGARSPGDGATNPSVAPHQRLDHVLVPLESVGVTAEVPAGGSTWAGLSDHLPLTVQMEIPDPT